MENTRVAEMSIQNAIYLKHSLELVSPLQKLLEGSENPLLKAFREMLGDERFSKITSLISEVISSEAHVEV